MLALLSAPRGRVSAARIAARVREGEPAGARRIAIRLPVGPAAPVTPDRAAGEPGHDPAAASLPGGSRAAGRWQEQAGRQ